MKHSLDSKGLSMTQAQTVSNLCNQAATEMLTELSKVNNARKVLDFNGKIIEKQVGHPLPKVVDSTLDLIGNYRACQAFLMEQIKAKDTLLQAAKKLVFVPSKEAPKFPEVNIYERIKEVDDQWGWDQLTQSEMAEYWEVEAKAAVIGQFIHKGGTLDRLRKELPHIEPLEWFVAPGHEGKAHPIEVDVHHSEETLWETHQNLANIHRELEQRVNYYKGKVKNLVTLKNAEINKENSEKAQESASKNQALSAEYRKEHQNWIDMVEVESKAFESARLKTIKDISALRINVDPRFQPVIDEFLKQTEE